MEDLLYHTPPAQRPHITLGDGSVVPLQPRHVYMVKVDVEGFDVAALHGLRRLLMEDERPVAVTLEFFPPSMDTSLARTPIPCDPFEFTRFMYDAGYVYENAATVDDMLESVRRALSGTGPRVFEGWWRLQPSTGGSSVAPPPSADETLTPLSQNVDATASAPSLAAVTTFCGSNAALEGSVGSSRFNEVVGDAVRRAAAASTSVGGTVLSAFLDGLSKQAPCHWARYTSLPLPVGVVMSACTHDPKVDTVLSSRIHETGAWFVPSVWSEFAAMLDSSGSCPPDRPVVLDLGLNIG
jgi:hypothetical protein